jgi:DNA-binding winged helix-turn-helix (wHTH) protein
MPPGRYSFGPFELDTAGGVLRRDGQPISLGQRGLALLEALLDADGQPVGKDRLLERAWPGSIVEEVNLTVQIAALRKALGTAPDGREWIVTVPRVGYRLPRPAALTEGRLNRCRSGKHFPTAFTDHEAAFLVFPSGKV